DLDHPSGTIIHKRHRVSEPVTNRGLLPQVVKRHSGGVGIRASKYLARPASRCAKPREVTAWRRVAVAAACIKVDGRSRTVRDQGVAALVQALEASDCPAPRHWR